MAFRVLGSPAPKGSARAFLNKRSGRAQLIPSGSATNAKKLASWATAVREAARDDVGPRDEPVFVSRPLHVGITFLMARPAGHWGVKGLKPSAPTYPQVKPDIDKLARTTLDAMTGLVFDDDSRIALLVLRKQWASPGDEGAWIRVTELPR